MKDNELNNSPALTEEEERRKRRKAAIIKMLAMVIFCVVVMIFGSIAWFTSNKETGTSGMGVRAGDSGFELKVADGNIGYSDLYSLLPSFSANESLITSNAENGDTIQWRISGSSDSIKPGSQGVLEFTIVTSGSAASSLHYDLDVMCYKATTSGTGNNVTVTGLTEITSSSATATQNEKDGARYLKSHLMFFKGRTGATEDVWQYNGFIENINDFTLTPEATSTAGEYTAKIYWIWPNTIGQIMLDSTNATDRTYLGSGVTSLLNSTGETNDRSAITRYLTTTNTDDIFNGSESYATLVNTLYTNRTASTSFRTQYDSLSAGYNAADLTIGKNVNFIAVLLQATANN